MVKKVIYLKDLPSNILSEAILIFKEDVDVEKDINLNNLYNIKVNSAIQEAKYIIEECMYKIEKDNENKKSFLHKIIDKVKGESNKK